MRFDWDAGKSAANRRKHGVSFEEAETVFGSLLAVTNDDVVHSSQEDRERTVGLSDRGRVLVVITVKRDDVIRIISARQANANELEEYEKEIQNLFGRR